MAGRKTLVVVTGPTASGKTTLAIEIAGRLGCEIISADSRQLYRGIPIGTAAPTPVELAAVPHHMTGILELDAYYNASMFERDVLGLLPRLWQKSDYAVMCGGSMMYVDAVTRGIDPLPDISDSVRQAMVDLYGREGIEGLRERLRRVDPASYSRIDLDNPRRLLHALEVTAQAGVPYSSLCTGRVAERPFDIVQMMIDHSREELFGRIGRRTRAMIDAGLEQEARSVIHLRHLNSLNTVGFKEMFDYIDGLTDLPTAEARIARNTRVYAKKQLTWLKRRPEVMRLDPASAVDMAMAAVR